MKNEFRVLTGLNFMMAAMFGFALAEPDLSLHVLVIINVVTVIAYVKGRR